MRRHVLLGSKQPGVVSEDAGGARQACLGQGGASFKSMREYGACARSIDAGAAHRCRSSRARKVRTDAGLRSTPGLRCRGSQLRTSLTHHCRGFHVNASRRATSGPRTPRRNGLGRTELVPVERCPSIAARRSLCGQEAVGLSRHDQQRARTVEATTAGRACMLTQAHARARATLAVKDQWAHSGVAPLRRRVCLLCVPNCRCAPRPCGFLRVPVRMRTSQCCHR